MVRIYVVCFNLLPPNLCYPRPCLSSLKLSLGRYDWALGVRVYASWVCSLRAIYGSQLSRIPVTECSAGPIGGREHFPWNPSVKMSASGGMARFPGPGEKLISCVMQIRIILMLYCPSNFQSMWRMTRKTRGITRTTVVSIWKCQVSKSAAYLEVQSPVMPLSLWITKERGSFANSIQNVNSYVCIVVLNIPQICEC